VPGVEICRALIGPSALYPSVVSNCRWMRTPAPVLSPVVVILGNSSTSFGEKILEHLEGCFCILHEFPFARYYHLRRFIWLHYPRLIRVEIYFPVRFLNSVVSAMDGKDEKKKTPKPPRGKKRHPPQNTPPEESPPPQKSPKDDEDRPPKQKQTCKKTRGPNGLW